MNFYISVAVDGGKKSKFSTGAIAGIAAAGGLLVIALIFVGLFALRQKRRAKELAERTDPFGKDYIYYIQIYMALQFLLCATTITIVMC